MRNDIVLSSRVRLARKYEDIPFAGGQAIDLSKLDEEKKDAIKKEVAIQAAKMSLSMITKPGLLASLTKLFVK